MRAVRRLDARACSIVAIVGVECSTCVLRLLVLSVGRWGRSRRIHVLVLSVRGRIVRVVALLVVVVHGISILLLRLRSPLLAVGDPSSSIHGRDALSTSAARCDHAVGESKEEERNGESEDDPTSPLMPP